MSGRQDHFVLRVEGGRRGVVAATKRQLEEYSRIELIITRIWELSDVVCSVLSQDAFRERVLLLILLLPWNGAGKN